MRSPKIVLGVSLLALLGLAAAWGVARADDEAPPEAPAERPQLTEHPLKDAKPGEYLRFMNDEDGWKTYFVERIVDVREGEVLLEIFQTNKEGKDLTKVRGSWMEVPEFKPSEYQRILEDEMVEVEVDGKKLWCRHLHIEQPQDPPMPVPKIRRDVWYSNDIPCSGKVKERPGGRIIFEWGTMSEEDLKKRQKAYEPKDGSGERKVPAD